MSVERPNIVITGFMGTGKSTVGKRIAQRSDRTFVDIDADIVAKYGAIPEIFAAKGEEEFRRIEREIVAEVTPRRNLVIATGGGTMLDEENVVAFLGAEIIALTASSDEIIERLISDGIESRPMLANASPDDPGAEIERLLESRSGAYDRFTQVDTTGKSVDGVVEAIAATGLDIAPPVADTNSDATKERILYAVITVMLVISIALVIAIVSF